ncbi:MAG TPA: sigma-70 family RNA polymerase sigma factor [Miltoncostaeaceae bacterium]|jgi:RNA polymerase sigma-70 factor (ECF subfamily)|nr:sigma-70 family RNA polymerase sigma factor [Miltoncostaeaceae bacterium]
MRWSETPEVVGSGAVPPQVGAATPDRESREWVRALRAPGAEGRAAMARLHEHLLRAARSEVARRGPGLPHLRGDELAEVAMEAADDALMSILRRLDDYRGDSRFTTWSCKFALLEAAVKLRRRAWRGRELPPPAEGWAHVAARGGAPGADDEAGELLAAVGAAIRDDLTAHQREVLVALAVDGVPIDVLAERRGTTRDALYTTLHDARRRLRAGLVTRGLAAPGEPS